MKYYMIIGLLLGLTVVLIISWEYYGGHNNAIITGEKQVSAIYKNASLYMSYSIKGVMNSKESGKGQTGEIKSIMAHACFDLRQMGRPENVNLHFYLDWIGSVNGADKYKVGAMSNIPEFTVGDEILYEGGSKVLLQNETSKIWIDEN